MESFERRYDIDWLRVIAIALLLIYHAAIVFQPWGIYFGFIQSKESLENLWIPMAMMNVWRIPLLFFVSGMGVCFAMRKRTWKALALERSKRILLPLLFGIVAIIPLHVFLLQGYYHQDLQYKPSRGHLWFLGNIYMYVAILLPLFYFLKHKLGGRFYQLISKLLATPLGLILVMVPFVLETFLIGERGFELYAMTLHGFAIGLLAFFFGFLFVYSGDAVWNTLKQWRWAFFFVAISLYLLRYLLFDFQSPNSLKAVESNCWIFSLFGFAYTYLNQPSKLLTYLSKAAYPIYIVHMFFLYLGAMLILPMEMHVGIKFILVTAFSFVGSFLVYDLIIKRVPFVSVLFGAQVKRKM